MATQNTEKWNEFISVLHDCKNALRRLFHTGCVLGRYLNMTSAQSMLDILTTNLVEIDIQNTHKCIETNGVVARDTSYQYATCCTATQESLYQRIFKNLMLVHENSLIVLDHPH